MTNKIPYTSLQEDEYITYLYGALCQCYRCGHVAEFRNRTDFYVGSDNLLWCEKCWHKNSENPLSDREVSA